MELRDATNADRDGVIALITSCYAEYGEVMYTAGADSDLLDIEGHYAGRDGAFVVLDDGSAIRGTHALVPLTGGTAAEPRVCTFRRLYLAAPLRGGEWGTRLMTWALDEARDRDFSRVEFWSDTRFSRAHRFFERLGFRRDGRVREMTDGAFPYSEYFFSFDVGAFDELTDTLLESFRWAGERTEGRPGDLAALARVVSFRIGDLLDRDMNRLTQLFYRLDLPEAEVDACFDGRVGSALCDSLADLFINRTRRRLAAREANQRLLEGDLETPEES